MRANRTLRFFLAHIKKLPQLSFKEKEVLSRRLKSVTLEKIGLKYKVTEGRIRQIEKQTLAKIKSKSYQRPLFKQ